MNIEINIFEKYTYLNKINQFEQESPFIYKLHSIDPMPGQPACVTNPAILSKHPLQGIF